MHNTYAKCYVLFMCDSDRRHVVCVGFKVQLCRLCVVSQSCRKYLSTTVIFCLRYQLLSEVALFGSLLSLEGTCSSYFI